MRSEIAKRILAETPQEVKDKADNYANKLLLVDGFLNVDSTIDINNQTKK